MAKAGITFTLTVLRDGREAIDYFSQMDKKKFPHPNWIISDLKMPHVSGMDVLKWLKKSHVQIIPTIILSSSNQPEEVTQAYQLGASSYFCKPTRFEDSIELWRTVCEYWAEAEFPVAEE